MDSVTNAIPVLLLLGMVVLVILYLRAQSQPRSQATPDGIQITDLFDDFMQHTESHNEHTKRLVGLVKQKFADSAIQEVRQELSETARRVDSAVDPIVALREAIMDEADTIVREQAILNLPAADREKLHTKMKELLDEEMRELETDETRAVIGVRSEMICRVLRLYALQKYEDVGEDDWLTYYWDACKSKEEVMLRMIQEQLSGGDPGVEAVLYKAWRDSWPQLRQFALEAAPREKIPRINERDLPR